MKRKNRENFTKISKSCEIMVDNFRKKDNNKREHEGLASSIKFTEWCSCQGGLFLPDCV